MDKHSIRYFGVTVTGERVPCTKGMKHADWNWTATCAPCGWVSPPAVPHKEIVALVASHKAGEPVAAAPAPADTTAEDVAAAAAANAQAASTHFFYGPGTNGACYECGQAAELHPEQPAPAVHPLLEKCIEEVAELAAAPSTKTPFKLYANGGMTIFSRKDRAVTAGDALGVTYTVVNPKGKVVASRVV